MDSNLDKALKKKLELEQQLRDLEQYIDLHKRLFGEKPEQSVSDANQEDLKIEEPRRLRTVRRAPGYVAKVTEAILREKGRPLVRGEILAELENRGLTLSSKTDKAKQLGTILWRNRERFINIPEHGYWLSGEDCPAVNYRVAQDPHQVGAIAPDPEVKKQAEADLADDMEQRGLLDD